MTKNLVIYEKTLSMIEYGTIALQQFPMMDAIGILPAMIAVKAVTILIVSGVYFLTPALRIGAAVGLGIASVFYVVVVVNNFKNARG